MDRFILAINPGSTSTKIAVFNNRETIFSESIYHEKEDLNKFPKIQDQYMYRLNAINTTLEKKGVELLSLSAVVGRGGLLRPIKSGVYPINQRMIDDLTKVSFVEHASNLGTIIAFELGNKLNIPSYISDPIVVDEFDEISRITGLAEVKKTSRFHALNQKFVSRKVSKLLNKEYEDTNLVVVHIGGGISVGAHQKGRVVDLNDALYGDGPFSPERAGKLPTGDVLNMCFAEGANINEIKKKLVGNGGLVSHLGTANAIEIEKKIENGDNKAKLVYEAMAYSIAKEIGAMATVLKGEVDGIVITGGIARSEMIVEWIKERVSYISTVFVYPGEFEMEAMCDAANRALDQEVELCVY